MRGRGAVRIRHRANRIYHCSDHGYSLNWLMSIFRSPGMLTFVHFALGILLIAAMGRFDVNCAPFNQGPVQSTHPAMASTMMGAMPSMDHCTGMAADSSNTQAPEHGQIEMCHVGCPTMLAAPVFFEGSGGLVRASYAAAPFSSFAGVKTVPQTPPPRWV